MITSRTPGPVDIDASHSQGSLITLPYAPDIYNNLLLEAEVLYSDNTNN